MQEEASAEDDDWPFLFLLKRVFVVVGLALHMLRMKLVVDDVTRARDKFYVL